MEVEIKDDRVSVKSKRGSAIIENKGKKITVIGVWSNGELKRLVDTVKRVREEFREKEKK